MRDGGLRALLAQSKRSFWLLFGGIWLLAGTIMLVVGIGMAVEEGRWNAAVKTTGMVLTKDVIRADADSSTEYRIRFRYTTDDGGPIVGSQPVDVLVWETLTERGPITVYFLPGSTEPARLDPDPEPFGALIFLAVGAGVGGVGGALFGRALRGVLRARRLMASGIDAVATVTVVEATDVSFNQRPQFRVRYRYADRTGATRAGDSGYLDWDEASTWTAGDRVAIRFDPRRPQDSVWIGQASPDADAQIVDAPPA